jgi:DNA-binding NtrC family response regulator
LADVLIIDDDLDGASALAELMEAEGHAVRIGYNGQEGMRLLEQRHPDLALLDVEMPVLNGPGMAYRMFMRNHGLERVPVVLVSGVPNLKEVAAHVGTPYFLGKPYRYEDLVAMVGRALADRVAPRPRPP